MPVGYSGKPLIVKLGVKSGSTLSLHDAPDGFLAELAPLPPGVRMVGPNARSVDCAILFTQDAASLSRNFAAVAKALTDAGMLWVAWPKKSSGVVTDVTEDVIRNVGLAAGLVDVKVCAVTEVWSALKFVRRLKDRKG
jgi:hypothetical protein